MNEKDFLKNIKEIMKEYDITDFEIMLTYIKSHKKTIEQRRKYHTSDKAKKKAKERRERERLEKEEFKKLKQSKEYQEFLDMKDKKLKKVS